MRTRINIIYCAVFKCDEWLRLAWYIRISREKFYNNSAIPSFTSRTILSFPPFPFILTVFLRSSGAPLSFDDDVQRMNTPCALGHDDATRTAHSRILRKDSESGAWLRSTDQTGLSSTKNRTYIRTCARAYFRRDLFLTERKIISHTLGEIVSRNEALKTRKRKKCTLE